MLKSVPTVLFMDVPAGWFSSNDGVSTEPHFLNGSMSCMAIVL